MSILNDLADNITVKLRDDVEQQPHAVEAVEAIEKVIKDQIRKGAFVTEEQLQDAFRDLIIYGTINPIIKGPNNE